MASALLFSNNAASNLAGPITSTATTLNVTTGAGVLFPNPTNGQYFKLTLLDAATKSIREIVHVTAVAGDVFTIVRAQESTTAVAWNAGDFAANQNTAGTMAYVLAALATQTNGFYQGTDTGNAANALVIATTSPTAPTSLVGGQLYLLSKNGQTNTGGVSAKIGTATTYTSVVYGDGTALNPGDYPAGSTAWCYYSGAVLQFLGLARSPAPYLFGVGAATAGTATALTTTLAPAAPAGATNFLFTAPISTTLGANATINCGLGAVPILNNKTGAAIIGGEAPGGIGFIGQFLYTGTNAILLNPQTSASSASQFTVGTGIAIGNNTTAAWSLAGWSNPYGNGSSNGFTFTQPGLYSVDTQIVISVSPSDGSTARIWTTATGSLNGTQLFGDIVAGTSLNYLGTNTGSNSMTRYFNAGDVLSYTAWGTGDSYTASNAWIAAGTYINIARLS